MNMLTPTARDKLVKILAMLGSDHDGERAAAGLMATRILKEAGIAWDDVVVQQAPRASAETIYGVDPFGPGFSAAAFRQAMREAARGAPLYPSYAGRRDIIAQMKGSNNPSVRLIAENWRLLTAGERETIIGLNLTKPSLSKRAAAMADAMAHAVLARRHRAKGGSGA